LIRLILLRHGNTFEDHQTPTQIGARTDLPLTEKGKMQAEQMAHFLKTQGIVPSAIYRGPLKRQAQTAQILGQHFQIADQIVPTLNEIDYGPWEGLTSEEIRQKWPQPYDSWTTRSVWPHSIFASPLPLEGIKQWLAHLQKTHPSETILAVSSNGLIRFFYAFQKEKWDLLAQQSEMEKIKVKTGHFCEVHLTANGIEIHSWNQNPSLEKTGPVLAL